MVCLSRSSHLKKKKKQKKTNLEFAAKLLHNGKGKFRHWLTSSPKSTEAGLLNSVGSLSFDPKT